MQRQVAVSPPAQVIELYPERMEASPVSRAWLDQQLYNLGIKTMESPETRPPGFYFNYSTAIFYVTIIALVAGGWWWSWQQADKNGYERATQEAEIRQLKERLNAAESDAKKAKDLQLANPRK